MSQLRGSPPPRDTTWFEDLFARTAPLVRAYVSRRVPADADDVVAEVYTVTWAKRDAVPVGAELPWLYAVAAREVLHASRGVARRTSLAERAHATAPPAEQDPSAAVVARVDAYTPVHQALATIPDKDAELLRLWAWEQLEPAEIAQVLGVSGATVRVRLHRARRRFAAALPASAADDGTAFIRHRSPFAGSLPALTESEQS